MATDWDKMNEETRAVVIELENMEADYNYCTEILELEGSVMPAADRLKDYYIEDIDEKLSAYSYTDYRGKRHNMEVSNLPFYTLYTTALAQIDWVAVARNFKPDEWGDSDTAPEVDDEPDDDDEPDYHEPRSESVYTLETHPDGKVTGMCWTNDNNDDGYPSSDDSADWPVAYRDVATALASTGGTHQGIGSKVTVYLDSVKVDKDGLTLRDDD